MSLVLDCSATVASVFPEESSPAIISLFDDHVVYGAWVPSLWKIEVANVLSGSVRRGRITRERRGNILANLTIFPISIDDQTESKAWTDTLLLADRHKLTVYDAAYLELALRRSLPLATLDKELRIAAEQEGVQLLGL